MTEAIVIEVLTHYGTPLEHHLVLCEGPGLVTEHELHLTELFGNVEGAALGALVVYGVIHQSVVMDEVNLHQLGNFYCNIQ